MRWALLVVIAALGCTLACSANHGQQCQQGDDYLPYYCAADEKCCPHFEGGSCLPADQPCPLGCPRDTFTNCAADEYCSVGPDSFWGGAVTTCWAGTHNSQCVACPLEQQCGRECCGIGMRCVPADAGQVASCCLPVASDAGP